jgi:hypothetical protein
MRSQRESRAGAEKYAKKIVHEQPEVTKSLDRAGVSALRTEISEAAAALADEVKGEQRP